ncbi:testis-expressed protein 36 isoform X1 [Mesocricetus auratus]|uniref:Testis-expressed protein 36 isoform X1 n=1 Tax=Mesocricetus auratus TaxID=10036 RepID=A0A1U7Q2L9_MESAU|nr:testis-expressed protein 36 isoform X1 [Mesocricetus auratus]
MIVRSWRGEEANLSTSSFSEKMAKGRQFNPPLDKVGRWFPHVGLVQKTPESVTSTTLKEIRCPYLSQQLERKLPPIYKVREKLAANKCFPFSVHDNRYSFENSGYYFDSGLGRKKISPDKRQHLSRNFNLWACDYIPSQCDGLSNNQTSYVHKEAAVISTFRRFPRCYEERWSAFKFVPNQSSTESLKNKSNKEFSVDTKAASPQEP